MHFPTKLPSHRVLCRFMITERIAIFRPLTNFTLWLCSRRGITLKKNNLRTLSNTQGNNDLCYNPLCDTPKWKDQVFPQGIATAKRSNMFQLYFGTKAVYPIKHPPRTNMTMEKQPFGDVSVSPNKNGVSFRGRTSTTNIFMLNQGKRSWSRDLVRFWRCKFQKVPSSYPLSQIL